MTLLIIGALGVLVVLAIRFVVIPMIDKPEGSHHASRPGSPPAGRGAPGLSAPVVEAARRSPGVWLWASRTPRQKKAARPAGRARKTTALRRWPTAITHRQERPLAAEDAATVTWLTSMRGLRHPGLTALMIRGRLTILAAVTDVPGRVTPAKDCTAASGDQVIAHASLGGEPGHPAGDHQAPTRGDAEGRDEPARAPTTGPAPGAELTGSLSPRQLIDGPRVASAPPPGPGTNGTRLLSREDRLAAELAATSPWTTNIPFDRWESDTFVGGLIPIPAEVSA